jgi:hypothetical protein
MRQLFVQNVPVGAPYWNASQWPLDSQDIVLSKDARTLHVLQKHLH